MTEVKKSIEKENIIKIESEDKKMSDTKAKETTKATKGNKSIEEILSAIENMTVLELSELVKAIEEKFEVSAQAMIAAAPAAGVAPAAGAAVEEKSEFDVVLKSAGEKKIQVIKVVRTITSLGLKEAKELVDKAPNTVKEKISKEEAENIQKQLEEAGAEVEVK